jgi:hypothetical protein
VLEQADDKGLLSGEHFSVDGTLIQAWAGHTLADNRHGLIVNAMVTTADGIAASAGYAIPVRKRKSIRRLC